MSIEIQLDGSTISRTEFPVCRAERDRPESQGQHIGRIRFSFKPSRSIVWKGYRDEKDVTKAGQTLDADIWQAGADPDALVIGVSFSDRNAIHMNTIHIAHPTRRDESEVAQGLNVISFPVTIEGGSQK